MSAQRALDLARLAADERTPIHEREAAALQLAKIVARDGLPRAEPRKADPSPFGYSASAQMRIGELMKEIGSLHRIQEMMTEIAKHNAAEIETLRADKRELEERVKARRKKCACQLCKEGDKACAYCGTKDADTWILGPTFRACIGCARLVGSIAAESDARKLSPESKPFVSRTP